jgi:lysophospholipid acyltransferase (LPLAT)-like uncharacterized protein
MSAPLDPVASGNLPQPPKAAHSKASTTRTAGRGQGNNSKRFGELKSRVYGVSDLSTYRMGDRLTIRAADISMSWAIRAICPTMRWEVQGREHLDTILASGHRTIFTSWHVCIVTATWFWRDRGIVVMSSVSRDAEYTGRVIKRFGYGTARGSATRGGRRALAEMARCLENGLDVGITIDGPRGPAYVAKPGAVTLARHTGQAILPFHVTTSSCIEIGSWDRLQIPLPFTRAVTLIGEPIYVPRDATSDEIEAKHEALQTALDGLVQDGKRWKEGIKKSRE